MYYNLDWQIRFKTKDKKWRLGMLLEVEIEKSDENLADTAVITLPESLLNTPLQVKDKIGRGDEVEIKLGYNGDLKTEFVGFIQDISTDGNLKIRCEDGLFLFRKEVKDIQMKGTSVKKIAEYLVQQIGGGYTVVCDFDIAYEKFVIHQATAYDVLKKLQEETKANIYFKTEKKELHIHAPFTEKGGYVIYCAQKNVEKSSLEYKKAIDRKFEVTVESVQKDGTIKTEKVGTTGGESVTIRTGAFSQSDIKKIANAELVKRSGDRYEGTIDTWLIPYVEPTYSAKYIDKDYPEQAGIYYVSGVTTRVSASGGVRTVKFGLRTAKA